MKLSEAIYNGLTNLGESLRRMNIDSKNHELESIKLGLVPDYEKLRMLKQKLYCEVRLGKDTKDLREAIHLLRKEVDRQVKARVFYEESLAYFFRDIILFAALAGGFSIFTTFTVNICSNRNSQYCNTVYHGFIEYLYGEDDSNLLPDNTEK